jgi:hypothetical protein
LVSVPPPGFSDVVVRAEQEAPRVLLRGLSKERDPLEKHIRQPVSFSSSINDCNLESDIQNSPKTIALH